MPRALSADRDLWGRTLSLLLIGFICYALPLSVFAALPASEGNQPVLRIQGSNTIGAKLGPELVKGLFEAQGLHDIHSEEGARENEQRLLARRADGRQVIVEVAAHGSGTGFTSLKDGSADLAASSRPIKDGEAATLATLGDLRSPQSEQVIAIDGLAIIVHPSNPIGTLSVEQIAQLFSGEIGDWAALGGKPGKVRPYARDDNSGTYDTFKELVLAPGGRTLAAGAQRFESSTQLSDAVSSDANGIGFIGLPYIRQAKAVAVAAGNSQPMPPSTTLIATEDYPGTPPVSLQRPATGQSLGTRADRLRPQPTRPGHCRQQRFHRPDRPGGQGRRRCANASGVPATGKAGAAPVGELPLPGRQRNAG